MLSGRQRLLFVFALLFFGSASIYTSIGLLSRVTPALFPGQSLPGLKVFDPLPKIVSTPNRDEGDGFFGKRINLLIIGVDKRPQDESLDGFLTDMIAVATIDPATKQMSMLNFPRDLEIDIHSSQFGVYQDRINTSYMAGFRADGRTFEAGALQLRKDLQRNFGIETNHWIVMDFTGVYKLIDSIGGIDVDIPYELSVPLWYYGDEGGQRDADYVSFPPGITHLDGYFAVAFGRYRDDSDLLRVKRQQLVMQTAVAKVFARGLLNNPLPLWDTYHNTIKTDMGSFEAVGYAPLLRQTNGTMQTFSLGDPVNGVETVYPFRTREGADVLLWNSENVQYWLSQVFTKAAYAQSNVEIQNGYGNPDPLRAAALGRYLQYSKGLPTVYLGPDAPLTSTTRIVVHDGQKRVMAEDIAKWMGLPASAIQLDDNPALPDVIIVVGTDFTRTPGG
ncbi:MAG: LCP family protein [Tepidiformaceae bacterium]